MVQPSVRLSSLWYLSENSSEIAVWCPMAWDMCRVRSVSTPNRRAFQRLSVLLCPVRPRVVHPSDGSAQSLS